MVNKKHKNFNILISALLALIFYSMPSISFSDDHSNGTNDPFERANRSIFNFNNTLDDYFFKPVAKGWRKVPDIPRKPIANLATTAKTPVSLANAVLQLNKESIGNILGKFKCSYLEVYYE